MESHNLINKLDLLNRAVLESMELKSEKEITKKFVNVSISLLNADFGFGFMAEKHNFRMVYKTRTTPYAPIQPRKDGIVSRAFYTRKPQLIQNVTGLKKIKQDAKQNMSSVAVIPLVFKNHNYGTLNICFKQTHFFDQLENILCSYIGNSAAQAMAISKLHANLEDLVDKKTKQLKKINVELALDKVKDEALLSSLGEGIVATNLEGKIIVFNPQAEEILGVNAKRVKGKNLLKAIPLLNENGQLVKSNDRPAYQAMTKRRKIRTQNYYVVRKNSNKIPVSITVTPIMLKGQLIGAIEVIHDITKEKEIDKAKSELISLASHQLRTPLSAINWYTEALIKNEMGPVNTKQKKYLREIFNANQKMIELVYDFLNVSRIELGTFVIQLSAFSPKEVANGVLQELKPQISKKKLKIEEIYGQSLDTIQADKKIIRLIFQNLLTNAVKYTPAGGKIKLKVGLAAHSKPHLNIEISDNGYGIPGHQKNKIFSKMFRGDNISQMQTEGTGLGLYIVKSFVDLCKGKITFHSKINKGTKFNIELPVQKFAAK